ncbi:MAG: nitrate ABC transporter permease [Burkholderiales bacterium]|nr:nitrate ABC transporter permease [Burkholderiales bacterium]
MNNSASAPLAVAVTDSTSQPPSRKIESVKDSGAASAGAAMSPAAVPVTAAAPLPTAQSPSRAGEFLKDWSTELLPPVITTALLVGIWEMVCSQPGASLPPPSKVISDTAELILNPFFDNGGNDVGMAWQLLASLKRVLYGYSIAVVVGISLGVLVGQFGWAMRGLDPIFQVLRTVPPLAWLPIALAGFRDGHPSAIFVIFITSVWPIIINTSIGIRNIPNDYRNVARVLRLNGPEYFWKIMMPAAAPYIFSGLRIGVGLSWLAIVAAEMLIGGVGIGFFIWDAWNSSRISDIVLALFYVGIVGFILDRLVSWVGRWVARGSSVN